MQYNQLEREKDGKWQVIVSYKNKNGEWKQKSKQGFKTKKLAKLYGDKILDELKRNFDLNIEKSDIEMTVGDLKEEFKKHIKIHRTANTYRNYCQALDILDIDNTKIINIKIVDIQKCINCMVDKYTVGTIERRLVVWKSMFNFANIQYNMPVPSLKAITIPKKKEEPKARALEPFEIAEVLETYRYNKEYYLCVLLGLNAGLRIGEIVGLTIDCINFNENKLYIEKQWQQDKEGQWGFCDLKGTNSYREIPISKFTATELGDILNSYNIDNYGKILKCRNTHSLVANFGNRILKKDFNCTLHDLRHTYGTKLIANGIDFKTAAKLLGHDIEQTMKIYSHVTDAMIDRATKIIEDIF